MVRRTRPAPSPHDRYPTRTCVGCRQRAAATELLRVVAIERGGTRVTIPDPARRLPGRGAWLHPDPACFVLAERRRAFGRALRVPGVIDAEAVGEYVTQLETGLGTLPGPTDEK
ncbi:YlxR family protein [Cryptosporangium japonicum]|uniref:YlxR family protein n=1 Tax=Cryptosporangium japonicum TaxID=80872 RepID=A0ABP3CYT7_9ACTN